MDQITHSQPMFLRSILIISYIYVIGFTIRYPAPKPFIQLSYKKTRRGYNFERFNYVYVYIYIQYISSFVCRVRWYHLIPAMVGVQTST